MEKNKKEESNSLPENQRFIADQYAEALLIRDIKNGRVDAVSELLEEKGQRRVVTVAPEAKNKPAFYQRKSSSFLANFISNYKIQKNNPYEAEFLIVPIQLIGEIASKLIKLQTDPKDPDGLKALQEYRAYPNNLEKIKFDATEIPWNDLKKMGIERDLLYEDKTVNELMVGRESAKQYELKMPVGENSSISGLYAIKLTRDEKDNVKVDFLSQLAKPEFELESYRRNFSTDEKATMLKGGTLNRLIKYDDGEYCYTGFNKNTNRLIKIPVQEVKVPDFLYGCRINDTQKEELQNGGKILLDKCRAFNSDNEFSCKVQYDVNRRDFLGQDQRYQKPYIPEFINKQLSEEQRNMLMNGQEIDGRGVKGRDGRNYSSNLKINPSSNNLEFLRGYSQPKEMQQNTEIKKSTGLKM